VLFAFFFVTERKDELEKHMRQIESLPERDDDDGKRQKKVPKRFEDTDADDVPSSNVGKPNVCLIFYQSLLCSK